ncbi:MAG: VOC family protein [Pseudomonadota bacterium]
MIESFDRIVLAVDEVGAAAAAYAALLGVPATLRHSEAGPELRDEKRDEKTEGEAWFVLDNTTMVLRSEPAQAGRIVELVFADESAGNMPVPLDNSRELNLAACSPSATAALRLAQGPQARVDHLVLRTADADDCVRLFAEALGLRLALDKTVEKWGGRMLFFRLGKLTLEVIETQEKKPSRDYFWGIAYQCDDLGREAERLRLAGVQLSAVRDGRKPGTRVATVKSHDLGVPTLLLQPAS